MSNLEIYTDGSYQRTTGDCTGAFVVLKDNELQFGARVNIVDQALTKSWNVSGELVVVAAALNVLAGAIGDAEVTLDIHYDYTGVKNFIEGPKKWKPQKFISVMYVKAFNSFKEASPNVHVKFTKVKAHSGIYWNEVVDSMAKGHIPTNCLNKMLPQITL